MSYGPVCLTRICILRSDDRVVCGIELKGDDVAGIGVESIGYECISGFAHGDRVHRNRASACRRAFTGCRLGVDNTGNDRHNRCGSGKGRRYHFNSLYIQGVERREEQELPVSEL